VYRRVTSNAVNASVRCKQKRLHILYTHQRKSSGQWHAENDIDELMLKIRQKMTETDVYDNDEAMNWKIYC